MARKLRVAQLAPLFESVPPRMYGGTERVVSWLVDQLVALGHEVTLFASADSRTGARLVPCSEEALRLRPDLGSPLAYAAVQLAELAARADEFDIVHNHNDYLPFPVARQLGVPFVSTMHGRLDLPELRPLFRTFAEQAVVSISDAQRQPLPFARWVGTVYHGLPPDTYAPEPAASRGHLAFLGRISPEKKVEDAIEVAIRAGIPLKIAAKLDPADRDYFDARVRHRLEHPLVEWVGEIGEHEKCAFLGSARALLFPIDWPEPFGLVMIEAMACGTPVITRPRGSVPEVIEDGVTGFICETLDELVDAALRAEALDRARIRERFEARFTADRMTHDYVEVFERVIAEHHQTPGDPALASVAEVANA